MSTLKDKLGLLLHPSLHDFVWETLNQGLIYNAVIFLVLFVGMWLCFYRMLQLYFAGLGADKLMQKLRDDGSVAESMDSLGAFSRRIGMAPRLVDGVIRFREERKEFLDEKVEEFRRREFPQLRSWLDTAGVLASIAPLLGLLGTVAGMVTTFETITLFGASNPAFMTKGIGTALLTTQNGLVAAMPIMFFHLWLRNRAEKIENSCDTLLHRLLFILNLERMEK